MSARGRPRGRRAGGADTRGQLVAAASLEFAEHGLESTSLRGVARRAGVDPSLVHHYFDSKDSLFAEAVTTSDLLPGVQDALASAQRDDAAETIVRTVLTVWGRLHARGLLRAVLGAAVRSEAARTMLRETILRRAVLPMVQRLGVDEPERRASLVAAQVIGLGMARYVIQVEPLASADDDEVVADIAPAIHRYLFDPLAAPTP